jgi:hypothetical protein
MTWWSAFTVRYPSRDASMNARNSDHTFVQRPFFESRFLVRCAPSDAHFVHETPNGSQSEQFTLDSRVVPRSDLSLVCLLYESFMLALSPRAPSRLTLSLKPMQDSPRLTDVAPHYYLYPLDFVIQRRAITLQTNLHLFPFADPEVQWMPLSRYQRCFR